MKIAKAEFAVRRAWHRFSALIEYYLRFLPLYRHWRRKQKLAGLELYYAQMRKFEERRLAQRLETLEAWKKTRGGMA
ncbi:MAG: hypothetical protein HY260_08060 [Chloroflexi bacterium]|nr:hypothetical protein [Chloroflexota bacterium]